MPLFLHWRAGQITSRCLILIKPALQCFAMRDDSVVRFVLANEAGKETAGNGVFLGKLSPQEVRAQYRSAMSV